MLLAAARRAAAPVGDVAARPLEELAAGGRACGSTSARDLRVRRSRRRRGAAAPRARRAIAARARRGTPSRPARAPRRASMPACVEIDRLGQAIAAALLAARARGVELVETEPRHDRDEECPSGTRRRRRRGAASAATPPARCPARARRRRACGRRARGARGAAPRTSSDPSRRARRHQRATPRSRGRECAASAASSMNAATARNDDRARRRRAARRRAPGSARRRRRRAAAGRAIVHSSGVARDDLLRRREIARDVLEQPAEEGERQPLHRKQHRRRDEKQAPHSRARHRRDGARGAFGDERVRPKRTRRTHAERRAHDVVPGQRRGEGIDVVWIAFDDAQPRVGPRHLLGRAYEGGDVVAAREREVDELRAGMSGGADDEDSLMSLLMKTEQPRAM